MAHKPHRKPQAAPGICPQCGRALEPTALACPDCGSDWNTGWSEGAEVDWETPDYDELLESEFGEKKPVPPSSRVKTIAVAALAVLLGLLLVGVFR